MMNENIEILLSKLKAIHQDLALITTDDVVVADWVWFKCRYGCRAYGKHLCCPTFAPAPDETRRMISEYCYATLVRFEAKPQMELLPQHIHHALWQSLTRFAVIKTVFKAAHVLVTTVKRVHVKMIFTAIAYNLYQLKTLRKAGSI